MIDIRADIQETRQLWSCNKVGKGTGDSTLRKYKPVLRSPREGANLNLVESTPAHSNILCHPSFHVLSCIIFPDEFCLSNDTLVPSDQRQKQPHPILYKSAIPCMLICFRTTTPGRNLSMSPKSLDPTSDTHQTVS